MNCFVVITCVLALTASSKADGLGAGLVYAPGHASVDYYAYPRYAFEYAVKDPHTGDNKAQWEKREGDVVKGAYSLVEPDGSLRVVEYWADDKSGFNAVVKRLGPNVHPVTAPIAPIYKAQIPVLESHGPIAPISVGPIAKYTGLASAPLLSGPLLGGGAISSASIYRPPVVSVAKAVSPILPAIESAPILQGPILSEPVYKSPIISAPLAAPIYKALPAPVIAAPYGLGLGGLGHLNGVGLGGGYLGGLGNYGAGLVKAPLAGPGYLEELGHGLLNNGLGLGAYGGYKH